MAWRGSVLIVDCATDSRRELRAVLEHRGLRIIEAADSRQGLRLVESQRPDVVLFDVEHAPGGDGDAEQALAAHPAVGPRRLILLGSVPGGAPSAAPAEAQRVAKPYHFAPLVRTIESLIDALPSIGPRGAA